ncbi:MAG TPA: lysylphosphatidylglycerol synthase domain-containing protein [Jatrophihabitans sp.]|uniref:lysylphosphatidylglycerol synthase transmembrane domain-containing protein n=1 Tax=Jatrophihabitans sp. TaxID=1932789 RepID=UPI002E094F7E|nr:lysylphosphatidylglycerol synthase domain-containing protein [Jatrophihabitans sp.]
MGRHAAGVARRRPFLVTVGAAAIVSTGFVISSVTADSDARVDVVSALSGAVRLLGRLAWPVLAMVVGLAALHYLAAAVAARAAAGVSTPLRETILVQLSASTANRLTPAGLGGSAVIARYLVKRAGLATATAIGAVAALTVLGGVADLLAFAALALGGRFVGLGGGPGEVRSLFRRVDALLRTSQAPFVWVAAGLLAATIGVLIRRRRHGRPARHVGRFLEPVGRLARRPAALSTLLAASAGTTVILAVAFALTTSALPGPRPDASVGGLVIGFMVGAAASNSIPIPAGLGATETALIGVLVAADIPAGQAFEEVMIFRVITFWIPALVGIVAARRLRSAGAL